MSLFRLLFPNKTAKERPDVQSMTIDEVWAEFSETVAPPGKPMLINSLRSPDYQAALAWLQPPTACPMAKS